MSATCPYGICDGSGFVMDVATNTDAPCRCRPLRVSQAKARRLEARIPRKYRDAAFDRWPVVDMPPPVVAEVRRFVADIDRNLDDGRGMWFIGDVGTGKTTLAMLVSKAALEAGRSVAIYSLPRLLNLIRDTIDAADGRLALHDRLAAVDLLHIDDVGAERVASDARGGDDTESTAPRAKSGDDGPKLSLQANTWVMEQLYSIINARYEDRRSIVITSNLHPEELARQIGPRTVSRVIEMCGDPLPLFGADRRRTLPDVPGVQIAGS